MRHTLRIALLPVALIAVTVPATASAAASTKLTGTVSAKGELSLAMAGKKVTTLKAGTYSLKVNDKSRKFEFRISGPGLDKTITSDTFMGSKTEQVKLDKGTYSITSTTKAAKGEKLTVDVS